MQRVRLIRKLAPILNGVDLSKIEVGDVITVSEVTAAMLIREGWAEVVIAGGKSNRPFSPHFVPPIR